MLIRPIQLRDLDELFEMAKTSSGGITTLPADKRLLHEKIERSLFAFSRDVLRPKGEAYLFVLEDAGKVVGCSGILSKTGGYEPICTFQVRTQMVRGKRIKVLAAHKVYDGPTEVGSLFLMPNYREGGLGKLLSLSRFLFIGIHPDRFDGRVAASYRGVMEDNRCPFWSAVGEPIFDLDFATVNRLRYTDAHLMEELLPSQGLYVPLLPKEIQKVIGKTHPRTRPALHLLQKQGFTYTKEIDPVDGGPFYAADAHKIGVIRKRRHAKVSHIVADPPKGKPRIIGNHNLHFRATIAPLTVSKGAATLSKRVAHLLQVERGDLISYIEVKC